MRAKIVLRTAEEVLAMEDAECECQKEEFRMKDLPERTARILKRMDIHADEGGREKQRSD